MKKVLIINGHPDRESFCFGLHERYKKGSLESGNEVKEIILSDMDFNPILTHGYRKRTEWEPDLREAWDKLRWAEHIVWIYPTWWASPPALLKGFIERLFLPGFTFEYQEKSPFPKKLLTGKTSEIISTMDSPVWYYKWIVKDIGGKMIRKNIGAFCGIRNIRTTYLAVIKTSTSRQREKWLNKVEKLGYILK
ncbi:MAG: NAD(P)H-dependent oxidoreductase [Prevotella sp.]|jgi:putative NADPH-quinone reductase|nr:NAD(P)H-dependent oxidoreductase [Prevotella sp.]